MNSPRQVLMLVGAAGLVSLLWIPAAAAHFPAPELVLSVEANGVGRDEVVLSYSISAPPEQVRSDVQEVSRRTGWPVQDLRIERVEGSSEERYSAWFTTPSAVAPGQGSIPAAALASALGRYPRSLLIFDIGFPFHYQGPSRYTDRDLDLILTEPSSSDSRTYAFRLFVRNAGFSQRSLPATLGGSGASERPEFLAIILALAAALGAGLVGYAVAIRLLVKQSQTVNTSL